MYSEIYPFLEEVTALIQEIKEHSDDMEFVERKKKEVGTKIRTFRDTIIQIINGLNNSLDRLEPEFRKTVDEFIKIVWAHKLSGLMTDIYIPIERDKIAKALRISKDHSSLREAEEFIGIKPPSCSLEKSRHSEIDASI